MKTLLLSVILILGIYSCQKDDSLENFPYEAIVMDRNPDCGIYAIKILTGLRSVESIAGTSPDSIYIAKNLPEELQESGLEILLDLREPTSNEVGMCTAWGPSYNWVTVVHARRK